MRKGGIRPLWYIGPALIFLTFFLVYPTLATLRLSFYGARSEEFVGFSNYVFAFTSDTMLSAFQNNLEWLIFFTIFTVMGGLVIAVLVDKVKYEPLAKSVIFLPQAISFVGAGVIWRYVYHVRPEVGVFNAILDAVIPDFQPIGWLVNSDLANYSLILIGIWMWAGFAMIILSAAIKGIPEEITDAARVDGASPWQMFWRVTVPMIASTIAVVATTLVINVLKIFDLIYVLTGARYDTNVIAYQMYSELYINRHNGRASAVAVVLLLAIVPVMLINIKRFQEQEAQR